MQLLDRLNLEQKQAVTCLDKRLLVLAGAGTGKTLVLTSRIAHLLTTHSVPATSIVALTFTNKAAKEMKTRVAALVGEERAEGVTLSTFHSFCMEILKKEIHHLGYTTPFTIYDPSEVERLFNSIAKEILRTDGEIPSLFSTILEIRNAMNKGLKPEEMPDSGSWHKGFVRDLFQRMLTLMRAHNAVDFDLMLYLTLELFDNHPEVLEKYRERIQYLLIDEFQDTNSVQFKIASSLVGDSGYLTAVGDDDQSIYGWRGADIRNILDLKEATTLKLEQNFRSTPTILSAANALIKNNETRHQKALWSQKDAGEKIRLFTTPTEKEEARGVIYRILHLHETYHIPLKQFAILYRSNSLSRVFETELLKTPYKKNNSYQRGIPYQIYGGLEFFERREVKDLFSYLRVLVNPKDQEALLRIINYPRRGIGDTTLSKLTEENRKRHLPLITILRKTVSGEIDIALSPKSLGGLKEFLDILDTAQADFESLSLTQAMEKLIDRLQFKKVLKEETKNPKLLEIKWENVQELLSSLHDFEGESTGKPPLSEYVMESPLLSGSQKDKGKAEGHDAVQLMTFHSAKGLEYNTVFLIALEDQILPHERSLENIEEERRLFYVAITRAKERLYMSLSKQRTRAGKTAPTKPSRFLYEVPKEHLKLTKYEEIES